VIDGAGHRALVLADDSRRDLLSALTQFLEE
jgi:hypothetical protein